MLGPPPLRELLSVALFGARGWFIATLLFGLLLVAANVALSVPLEPKAVVLAFFMPLFISALFGTVALGTYRARQESAEVNKALRKRVFLAAVCWNCIFGLVALVVDQAVIYFNLLQRAPFEFPQSLGAVVAMATGVAVLAVYPRHGPQ